MLQMLLSLFLDLLFERNKFFAITCGTRIGVKSWGIWGYVDVFSRSQVDIEMGLRPIYDRIGAERVALTRGIIFFLSEDGHFLDIALDGSVPAVN